MSHKMPIMDHAALGWIHFRSEDSTWNGRDGQTFCTMWDVEKEGNRWTVSRFVVPTNDGDPCGRGEQEGEITDYDSLSDALLRVMTDAKNAE